MWLRMVRRSLRARSRMAAAVLFPLSFLFFFGYGFRGGSAVDGLPQGTTYLRFLTPGVLAMTLLFSSTFTGISSLWDRQSGFLREIMVTPVSRLSILLGRVAGGLTLSLGQAFAIFAGSLLLGTELPPAGGGLVALVAATLTATGFISMGLVFASLMRDPQGFGLVMNFLIFPLFLLSGALYPVENLPRQVRWLAYLDPLTYGVDALRGGLLGVHRFGLALDLGVLGGWALLMIGLGVLLFRRVEVG